MGRGEVTGLAENKFGFDANVHFHLKEIAHVFSKEVINVATVPILFFQEYKALESIFKFFYGQVHILVEINFFGYVSLADEFFPKNENADFFQGGKGA